MTSEPSMHRKSPILGGMYTALCLSSYDTHTNFFCSGQEHELLDWLAEVTFPMEARFKDVDFAKRAYGTVVRRIIDSGVCFDEVWGTLSGRNS